MEASSANTGFFQEQPVLRNQYYEDVSLRRVLGLFVPPNLLKETEPEISKLGQDVLSDEVFAWVTDAEKNLPYLRGNGRDAFGKPRSELVTSEGWRKLQEFGIERGMVAYNYDTDYAQYTRVLQQVRLHLWEASAANVTCPSAMHDGAARLLQRHLASPDLAGTQRRVLQDAFGRLCSRNPRRAWTSGQWMTERVGGSDVSQTETVATYSPYLPAEQGAHLADAQDGIPLGPWSITGHKWFTSASDSGMTILLARTRPDMGVSAFLVPLRRHNPHLVSAAADGARGGSELNGLSMPRLKSKLGTQSLPTSEMELRGTRGWLIGREGGGIQEIATILTITRIHSAVAALGYIGRGLAVARAYARVREVGAGKGRRMRLTRCALHMRTLATMTGEYHAMMLLAFLTTYVQGLDETASNGRRPLTAPPASSALASLTPPAQHVAPLLRVLSSLHKAACCKLYVPLMHGCMEALGGVGYLLNAESEHMNLARLFRDGCVLPIWEGTTDVLSTDMLRALKHPAAGRESLAALDWFVGSTLGPDDSSTGGGGRAAREDWAVLKARLEKRGQEQLLPEARDIMMRLAEILMAALLLVDARRDQSPEVAVMCRRFMVKRGFGAAEEPRDEDLDMDLAIVYGRDAAAPDTTASAKL